MNNHKFTSLELSKPILQALADEGYKEPTPIQVAAIPTVLSGRDLMATAQTGTGKTAAFALPMLQLLSERRPRANGNGNGNGGKAGVHALILTPTRELALQIDASLRAYGRHLPLRTAVVLGGVPIGPQIRALSKKPDIVVATPGRLLDLTSQGHLRLNSIEMLVLDEADRMLDMGFIHDMRKIVKLIPKDRQTLLFSATLTQDIARLASNMLRNPSFVEVTPTAIESGKISQKVLFVRRSDKLALLSTILRDESVGRTLVFTRTKHKADRVMRSLTRDGISADSIHSNKTQNARGRALSRFERGTTQVLVATDIVARGIDVDGISHVVNYELPNDAESYVHRIGRTARAGADGTAYSFCDADELAMLHAIEKLTKTPLDAHEDHPFHAETIRSRRYRISSTKRVSSGGRKRYGSRGRRAYR
ncbi:MAG: DEAD/DEAH box helicase [Candidatus Krumholzibacteriota bacterium]|nr:DEAD/DEAH box helicase [Candidatus Krumholzibacteriota bacterium]